MANRSERKEWLDAILAKSAKGESIGESTMENEPERDYFSRRLESIKNVNEKITKPYRDEIDRLNQVIRDLNEEVAVLRKQIKEGKDK